LIKRLKSWRELYPCLENILGRSYPFWQYYFPKLKEIFPKPLSRVDLELFYKAINKSEPSLIRVEADEVTYSLHVILRFELELQLITGEIKIEDLPEVWKNKMDELLGVKPETDAEGILQDVHWSIGIFGYFPTYVLGNLYGAQFFDAMKKEIPDMDEKIANGDFKTILNWYRTKIHQHGAVYSANELCHRVTKEELKADYFMDYLTKKYTEIYKLK
jgi:carboxypeptidase Taq